MDGRHRESHWFKGQCHGQIKYGQRRRHSRRRDLCKSLFTNMCWCNTTAKQKKNCKWNSTGLRLLWPWPLTFWGLTTKSNQHTTNRNTYVIKIGWNSFHWFFEIWYLQGFRDAQTHSSTHSLIHSRTDRPEYSNGTVFQRWRKHNKCKTTEQT